MATSTRTTRSIRPHAGPHAASEAGSRKPLDEVRVDGNQISDIVGDPSEGSPTFFPVI